MPYGRIGGGSTGSSVISVDADGFRHIANQPPDKLVETVIPATGKTRLVHVVKDSAGNEKEIAAIEY